MIAHRVLADLQRGARLLVRAVRPARQHDRAGRVLPGPDRAPACSSCAGRSRSSASTSFEPGDVVLHNDPYRGGAHIPEHSVIRRRLPRGRALRLRRERRAPRGDRRQGGRQLRRRCHRGLPGGPADPAGEDRQARRERHGAVAADHGQPPHAAEHVGRPQRADRLAAGRRAARARAARPLRARVRRSRPPTS